MGLGREVEDVVSLTIIYVGIATTTWNHKDETDLDV